MDMNLSVREAYKWLKTARIVFIGYVARRAARLPRKKRAGEHQTYSPSGAGTRHFYFCTVPRKTSEKF
jgi:hypothetical protein